MESRPVFLSYASEDRERVRAIAQALREAGVEAWFDQAELRGGDAWDAAIRQRIADCVLFLPVVSDHTQRRSEGYFRLEWKLAVERSHRMAGDRAFLLPLLLDEVDPATARVPAAFLDVQWSAVRAAAQVRAFVERTRELLEPQGGTARFDAERSGVAATVARDLPPPHNLPAALTSFIGRADDLRAVHALLAEHRLVTLLGPGGAGKTRLATEVASSALDRFEGGAWLVELAAVRDPALVPQAIAAAIGAREAPSADLLASIARSMSARPPLLLVLDNCEHLVEACALAAERLLAQAPSLRVLATSREPLRTVGEATFTVAPLASPREDDAALRPEALAGFASVQLFVDRARAVRPAFVLDPAQVAAVASICRRLDGIPLAIELAAARLRAMTAEEIAARLDQRFRLLTGGARTALPRQQTLQSLVDWSYDLLAPGERLLLQRLSVFAGGWSLAAAEDVCGTDGIAQGEVMDLLASLVDKSLVLREERTGNTRYGLLETIREYAADRLQAAGDVAEWQRRHFDFHARQVQEQLARGGLSPDMGAIEVDLGNLRAALRWSVEHQPLEGLVLAERLRIFWFMRGHLQEGSRWLSTLLQRAGDTVTPELRSASLNALSHLLNMQGRHDEARPVAEQGLAIARSLGQPGRIASHLRVLGLIAAAEGRFDEAWTFVQQAVDEYRRQGERHLVSLGLNALGTVASKLKRFDDARVAFEESLALAKETGFGVGIATGLNSLGSIAADQGDTARAEILCAESLRMRSDRDHRYGASGPLMVLAVTALQRGDPARATRLLAAAQRLHRDIGLQLDASDQADLDALAARIAASGLDDDALALARTEGDAMTLDDAIRYALATLPASAAEGPPAA